MTLVSKDFSRKIMYLFIFYYLFFDADDFKHADRLDTIRKSLLFQNSCTNVVVTFFDVITELFFSSLIVAFLYITNAMTIATWRFSVHLCFTFPRSWHFPLIMTSEWGLLKFLDKAAIEKLKNFLAIEEVESSR